MANVILVAGTNHPSFVFAGKAGRDRYNFSCTRKLDGAGRGGALPQQFAGVWEQAALNYAAHSIAQRKAMGALPATYYLFNIFKGQIVKFEKLKNGHPVLLPIAREYFASQPFAKWIDRPQLHRYRVVDAPRGDTQDQKRVVLLPVKKDVESGTKNCAYFPLLPDDKPITLEDYVALRKKSSRVEDDNTLGIIHLYAFIAQIAERDHRSIAELHFFSHAWRGGPILLNTYDLLRTSKHHDDFDKDPRVDDFDVAENPFIVKLFKESFLQSAFSVVWGCDSDPIMRDYIREVTKLSRDAPTFLHFSWPRNSTAAEIVERRADFLDVFGGYVEHKEADDDKLVAEVTQEKFAKALKERAVATRFNKTLARTTGCPVFGALPGTWATYDEKKLVPKQTGPVITHIAQGRPDDRDPVSSGGQLQDLRDVMRFCRDHFPGGVTFDLDQYILGKPDKTFDSKLGRGYAMHSP